MDGEEHTTQGTTEPQIVLTQPKDHVTMGCGQPPLISRFDLRPSQSLGVAEPGRSVNLRCYHDKTCRFDRMCLDDRCRVEPVTVDREQARQGKLCNRPTTRNS